MKSTYSRFTPPSAEIENRINQTIDTLTLEEKCKLLGGNMVFSAEKDARPGDIYGLPQSNIPPLKFADGPNGVHWWTEASTSYPVSICLAATWNPDSGYSYGEAIGRDARARGIHVLLAPGVNIYRSPLCGRNFEYLGEDPFLASKMVAGYIEGCQNQGVAATVKHYALNFQEYDRHGISSNADERTLREIYLPAFKTAVQEAGAAAVMTSYNLINSEHASEHRWLLLDILKGEWEFDGIVMSDWVSTYSTENAANHGLDLEMPSGKFLNAEKLISAIDNATVTEETINDKIRRRLRMTYCFGWDKHEQKDETIPFKDPETLKVALETAREGCVLLKNEGNILPLEKAGSISVLGMNAHPAAICGGGSAYNPPHMPVSVLDGIKELAGEKGIHLTHEPGPQTPREVILTGTSRFTTKDGKKGLHGRYFDNNTFSGEPVFEKVDEFIDFRYADKPPLKKMESQFFSIRWKGFITAEEDGLHDFYVKAQDGIARLWINDQLIIDESTHETNKTLSASLVLEKGRSVSVVLEYAKTRHWAKIQFGWEPASAMSREMSRVVEAAKHTDIAVICTGFNRNLESEGWDRTFALPAVMEEMIQKVSQVNKNTIVCLFSGGNVDMSRWIDDAKGILQVWYPGEQGGRAIAEILFGKVNPSGRLPATYEHKLEDRSSFDSYHAEDDDKHVFLKDGIFTGYRHHDRVNIKPRFPFGYGLSYTQFEYSGCGLSRDSIKAGEFVDVSFEITNTGKRDGADVAQIYIGDDESSLPRPVKELKAFKKVFLNSGEKRTITLGLGPEAFSFFHSDKREWIIEPGSFTIYIARSAREIVCAMKLSIST